MMHRNESIHPEERALWSRLTQPEATPCPDPLTLAAWMDGRLDTPVADAVERHLAGCADCVAAVHDARGAIAESRDAGRAPFAFHRVVSEALHGRRRHRESPLVLVARWSIAVAAGAAACWIGFTAGAGVAPNGPVAPADDLLDSMTFGLLDGDAEGVNDDLLQFALAASSVGLTEAPR